MTNLFRVSDACFICEGVSEEDDGRYRAEEERKKRTITRSEKKPEMMAVVMTMYVLFLLCSDLKSR